MRTTLDGFGQRDAGIERASGRKSMFNNSLLFSSIVLVALGGCDKLLGAGDAGASDASGPPGAGGSAGSEPGPVGSSDSGVSLAPVMLGFTPSNVPTAMPFRAPGDLIFSMQTCSRPNVELDTSKGTINGCDAMKDAFAFSTITQSDMSLGALPAALFVTHQFVVQTGMTVSVVGNLPLLVVALGDVNISGGLTAPGGSAGGGGESPGAGPGAGGTSVANSGCGGGGFCGKGGDGANNPGSGGKIYGNANSSPLLARLCWFIEAASSAGHEARAPASALGVIRRCDGAAS
jgi:hypothetical protein